MKHNFEEVKFHRFYNQYKFHQEVAFWASLTVLVAIISLSLLIF